ncbi:MAG: 50S ribosomal protein L32e [Candidatus Aenigmarchaeota archaeon]|nr:50S ribosomal protein L32e [Candidatus Aenigmarchaeota archaeon]
MKSEKYAKKREKEKAKLDSREKTLLRIKIRKNRKTPRFKRQELWAQAMLKDTWRRPKGRHSKMRKQERGRGRIPKPGYGSPAALRGLDRQGFLPVRVFNLKDLEKLDPEKEKAVIASTVGRKKRLEILKKAEEKGIAVANA